MGANYSIGPYNVGVYSYANVWNFSGDLAPTISFAGSFSTPQDMAAAISFIVPIGSPVLNSGVGLAGGFNVNSAFGAATMNYAPGLSGALDLMVTFNPSYLGDENDLQGKIAIGVTFAGLAPIDGPLWAEDEPCMTTSPWVQSAMCEG